MLVPYRDLEGYVIKPSEKPIFDKNRQEMGWNPRIRFAKYVQCQRADIQGLIWIGHCEDCKYFGGHVKYQGIKCNVKTNKTKSQWKQTKRGSK